MSHDAPTECIRGFRLNFGNQNEIIIFHFDHFWSEQHFFGAAGAVAKNWLNSKNQNNNQVKFVQTAHTVEVVSLKTLKLKKNSNLKMSSILEGSSQMSFLFQSQFTKAKKMSDKIEMKINSTTDAF